MNKLIDPSPFSDDADYIVPGHLLSQLWRFAHTAGNYGLTHDENRDLQNFSAILRDQSMTMPE